MHISKTQKIILSILMFALAGYILYNSYSSDGSVTVSPTLPDVNGIVATDNSLPGGAIDTEGQDIIDLAYKLNTISIDPNLFASPLFTNLKDFDGPLSPESLGRPNPFATIGLDGGFQSIPIATSSKPAPSRP